MTYQQFFNEDPYLVRFYKKKYELELDKMSTEYWILGKYIDEAISVNLYNGWGRKKGQPAIHYRSSPFDLTGRMDYEQRKRKEEVQAEAWMHNFVNRYKSL